MNQTPITIIGAGLAGTEAALQLANHNLKVKLFEMRPQKMTPAHKTSFCAELVCSNSFKSKNPASAPGMLKQELLSLNSSVLSTAMRYQTPAGEALGVDRDLFSQSLTDQVRHHPCIEFVQQECLEPPDKEHGITLIATGPLTSEALTTWMQQATGQSQLYFYDAIAPIVDATTIDFSKTFVANRYNKGEVQDYLNIGLSATDYQTFYESLLAAEKLPAHPFEKEIFFQGCQPIEQIALSGKDSLRFGPMKPVGLTDPHRPDLRFSAVVQLRPENIDKTAYNFVGFQTRLTWPEQKRIFRMLPGLQDAEFFRMGCIHRNTYVNAPNVVNEDLSLKLQPHLFLAGQITGVEGYLESTACGLLAARSILARLRGQPWQRPPRLSALGALLDYITKPQKHFAPTNMHFGLFNPSEFPGLGTHHSRILQREKMAQLSYESFLAWKAHAQ
jgi:methylenetetrahydrofolate--tRNA-(uracil-5-)-methyltransferase